MEFARFLRRRQTHTEELLWRLLRSRRFRYLKFRRQVPIGPFFADFVYLHRKVIVEIDGPIHVFRKEYDADRDAYLQKMGYRVLRFTNREVRRETNRVLEEIFVCCFSSP